MLFIEDSSGEKVATATAFYDSRDTSGAGWLHWVAVKRTQQGKGLARPLISKALHRLTELGYTDIKVPTQTNTWVAAKLYLDAGFIPEEKNAVCSRDGYRILKTLTGHPSLEGIEPLPFEDIWDQEMLLTEKNSGITCRIFCTLRQRNGRENEESSIVQKRTEESWK